jgi:hypothetical protein
VPLEVNLGNILLKIGISIEGKQCCAVTFFLAEGHEPIEIHRGLSISYQDDPMKKSTCCFWVAEIRAGRSDFSKYSSTARPLDRQDNDLTRSRPKRDPYAMLRQIAHSLGIAASP